MVWQRSAWKAQIVISSTFLRFSNTLHDTVQVDDGTI